MKKITIVLLLGSLTMVSCRKEVVDQPATPVQLKVQAVDKDNTIVESNILFIK